MQPSSLSKDTILLDETLVSAIAQNAEIIFRMERELETFVQDPSQMKYVFPPSSSYLRLMAHRLSHHFSMRHTVVTVQGGKKAVCCNKTEHTCLPPVRLVDVFPGVQYGSVTVSTSLSESSGLEYGASPVPSPLSHSPPSRRASAPSSPRSASTLTQDEMSWNAVKLLRRKGSAPQPNSPAPATAPANVDSAAANNNNNNNSNTTCTTNEVVTLKVPQNSAATGDNESLQDRETKYMEAKIRIFGKEVANAQAVEDGMEAAAAAAALRVVAEPSAIVSHRSANASPLGSPSLRSSGSRSLTTNSPSGSGSLSQIPNARHQAVDLFADPMSVPANRVPISGGPPSSGAEGSQRSSSPAGARPPVLQAPAQVVYYPIANFAGGPPGSVVMAPFMVLSPSPVTNPYPAGASVPGAPVTTAAPSPPYASPPPYASASATAASPPPPYAATAPPPYAAPQGASGSPGSVSPHTSPHPFGVPPPYAAPGPVTTSPNSSASSLSSMSASSLSGTSLASTSGEFARPVPKSGSRLYDPNAPIYSRSSKRSSVVGIPAVPLSVLQLQSSGSSPNHSPPYSPLASPHVHSSPGSSGYTTPTYTSAPGTSRVLSAPHLRVVHHVAFDVVVAACEPYQVRCCRVWRLESVVVAFSSAGDAVRAESEITAFRLDPVEILLAVTDPNAGTLSSTKREGSN